MVNVTRESIANLVLKCVDEIQGELENKLDLSEGEQTRLFGGNGQLDSLTLVVLIVNIEEALQSEFEVSLILADERAMSRRTSPFARVGSLIDYIFELIQSS